MTFFTPKLIIFCCVYYSLHPNLPITYICYYSTEKILKKLIIAKSFMSPFMYFYQKKACLLVVMCLIKPPGNFIIWHWFSFKLRICYNARHVSASKLSYLVVVHRPIRPGFYLISYYTHKGYMYNFLSSTTNLFPAG